MKKKSKWLIFGLLSISICVTGTIVLTSCSNSKNAKKTDINKINLYFNNYNGEKCLSPILWEKSIYDWQNDFQNNNINSFIDGLSQINNDVMNKIDFVFNNSTNATIIPLDSLSDDTIFINALATFKNSNEILEIQIDNLLAYTNNNIQKPCLNLVNNGPIEINQVDLPSISNTNPEIITDQEWTQNLNSVYPGCDDCPGSGHSNSNCPVDYYIPNTIYYLESRKYISSNVYQLIYKINDQYNPILDINEFPEIIFNINISPNIDKEIVTNFQLSNSDVVEFFPNLSKEEILSMNSVEVFNCLNNYVNSLPGVHSLIDCIDHQNNSVFNYSISDQEITNSILIKFSSNPNLANDTIYFYSFTLEF